MIEIAPTASPSARLTKSTRQVDHDDHDLLLRETNHRCSNDLQLVVGLLALQSRRAVHPEVREALENVMKRVAVLAHARRAIHQERPATLELALQQVCDALHAQAEPRSIAVSFHAADAAPVLPANCITTAALVVNELATNANKHAFAEGKSGHIRVTVAGKAEREAVIFVDDDGLPFPDPGGEGLGMGIAKRLMASIGGLFIPPRPGTKIFELRVGVT